MYILNNLLKWHQIQTVKNDRLSQPVALLGFFAQNSFIHNISILLSKAEMTDCSVLIISCYWLTDINHTKLLFHKNIDNVCVITLNVNTADFLNILTDQIDQILYKLCLSFDFKRSKSSSLINSSINNRQLDLHLVQSYQQLPEVMCINKQTVILKFL